MEDASGDESQRLAKWLWVRKLILISETRWCISKISICYLS